MREEQSPRDNKKKTKITIIIDNYYGNKEKPNINTLKFSFIIKTIYIQVLLT